MSTTPETITLDPNPNPDAVVERRRSRLGAGLVLALLLALGLGLGLSTASPASAATTNGNICQANRAPFWTSSARAQGCLIYHGRGTGWIRVTPAAVDVASDGYSALGSGAVEQWVGGRWVDTYRFSVTNSAGFGRSEYGLTAYVNRSSGATHWRVRTVACARNGANGNPFGCVTDYSSAYRW